MLKSHPLFSACCQGCRTILWKHTVKPSISPKYHIWVWVVKNQVSFTESHTDKFLIHVAVLMSEICCGVQAQQASMPLGAAVWSPTGSGYASAPFPTSHWRCSVHGRTSSSCEGKSKQNNPYFSVLSPLLLVALSGNSLLVVFIHKSDNISQIPSHQRAAIYSCGMSSLGLQKSFPLPKKLNTFKQQTAILLNSSSALGCVLDV